MNCGSILVVDGDADSRRHVSELLQRAGFSTDEAASGEEALAATRREPPALVVLEVVLPGLSGYEICRQLRNEFGEELPIIFVSAEKTDEIDQIAGLLVGGDDYLAKPFVPDLLLARIRRLVARSTAPAPRADPALTRREREVLSLLGAGRPRPEIARELGISRSTVGKHIEHILAKLGVHNQAQAVAVAIRRGLVIHDVNAEHAPPVPERAWRRRGLGRREDDNPELETAASGPARRSM
jgi:DNA-binding NarL/FixJ family response regulator